MLKVELKNDNLQATVDGNRKKLSEELAQLFKILMERKVFESSDIACILAITCNETNQKIITRDSKQAMRNLIKKI